jgi:hypothetical protein
VFAAADALGYGARGLGLALLQQAVESWMLARPLAALGVGEIGVWQGPPGWNASLAVRRRALAALAGLRCLLALWLLLEGPCWALPASTLATYLSLLATRGPMNGGSDSMTVTLGLGLSLAWLGADNPVWRALGLYFVAVHAVLSYFVAGVSKLKEPSWRSGAALLPLLGSTRYAAPAGFRAFVSHPLRARVASYAVLAMECAFPLALLGPIWTIGFLSLGSFFHVLNGFALGLHRFWPVWLSTYPAVAYLSDQLARGSWA